MPLERILFALLFVVFIVVEHAIEAAERIASKIIWFEWECIVDLWTTGEHPTR